MKKAKVLALIVLASISISTVYADSKSSSANDNLSPEGYWAQFDEESDVGHGKVQGIVHSYFAPNNQYGKKGSLEMRIVVPIMYVSNIKNEILPPKINCSACGSGEKNGFKYSFKDSTKMQGLVFSSNNQKMPNTSTSTTSAVYDNGGVLNPLDGKTYSSKVQVQDDGKTMFARAYKGSGWLSVGKDAHWKRITKQQYQEVKAKCGLTKNGVYPYEDMSGKVVNEKLFKQCYNYDFDVDKPTE